MTGAFGISKQIIYATSAITENSLILDQFLTAITKQKRSPAVTFKLAPGLGVVDRPLLWNPLRTEVPEKSVRISRVNPRLILDAACQYSPIAAALDPFIPEV